MSSFSYVIGLVSEAPIMAGLVFLAILLSVAASLTYRALLASKLSGWFSFSNVPDWARLASKVEFVTAQNSQEPSLHLVGAGTGDPGLLTLAALHAIQQADLVIADILVSSDILKLVDTRKTEIKIANKVKGRATIAQREIESWIVDGLEKQLRVVRLKGGDPYVYGRGAEEIMAARAAGFGSCISMIPGISSTLAAPAAAGIALTSRGVANQFVVTTGVGAEGAKTTIPPYKPTRTTVLLMSVRRIQSISERMIKEGYPARTPVCIVERASTPSQRSTNTNLHALSEGYASVRGIASPATIVVGTVADETYRLPGYKRLPTTIQSNNNNFY